MSLYCCLNYHICKQRFFKGERESGLRVCVCVCEMFAHYFEDVFILKFSVLPMVNVQLGILRNLVD